MLRITISYAGLILDSWEEYDLDDALHMKAVYQQAGFEATVTRT